MTEVKALEELNEQADRADFVVAHGSGSLLATARKQQQKTIEEIAGQLNLSVTQIKTIELDQTDGLPEPTYVRGYIRGYAKLLGLNPEEVLKNYLNPNWQQSSSLTDIPRGISSAEEAGSRFFTPAKLVSLLILVAAAVFLWYSGMMSELIGSNSSNSSTPLVTVEVDGAAPVQNKTADEVDLRNDGTEPVSIAETALPTSGENTAVASQNELLLTFTETSWVDIRDQQDNRLAYKSYVQGEELRVSSNTSMSVFIGNAAGVRVEFNGSAFDISEFREGVYAKFLVGE